MEQIGNDSLAAASVYALFASVLSNEPDAQQVERMGLLLEAAGAEAPATLPSARNWCTASMTAWS